MHPGKVLGNITGFVGLDWADKMPLDIMFSQLLNFLQCLLQVIFTKGCLACTKCIQDIVSRPGFTDSLPNELTRILPNKYVQNIFSWSGLADSQ